MYGAVQLYETWQDKRPIFFFYVFVWIQLWPVYPHVWNTCGFANHCWRVLSKMTQYTTLDGAKQRKKKPKTWISCWFFFTFVFSDLGKKKADSFSPGRITTQFFSMCLWDETGGFFLCFGAVNFLSHYPFKRNMRALIARARARTRTHTGVLLRIEDLQNTHAN